MAIQIPRDFRRVIVAASVGNVIEWYDFYIFGSLAAILSVKFFEKSHPVAALLSTIALFTAGFLVRPLGAFLFGWLGGLAMTLPGIATALAQDTVRVRGAIERIDGSTYVDKPGAKVFIAAIKQPDGTLKARAWRIGRDGVTPPM